MKPPIKHDENRERDVQALAMHIYYTPPYYNSDSNIYRCPFCDNGILRDDCLQADLIMPQITHDVNCPWKIAERLYVK